MFRAVTHATPDRDALSIAICIARFATRMPKALSPSSIAVDGVSFRSRTLGFGFSSPSLIMLR